MPLLYMLLACTSQPGLVDSEVLDSGPLPPVDAPNIVLVIADDMGLDASPCHAVGDSPASMPTLEALCAQGMVMEQAYAAPLCTPTRAMLMTGRFGFRTGVGGLIEGREPGLSGDELSLFDVLEAGGYSTALVGKWHLSGRADDNNHPQTLGIPEYYGLFSGSVSNYYSWTAVHNGLSMQVEQYASSALVDHAEGWLAEQEGPWFLWLAFNAPHTPFHLPPADLHSQSELTGEETDINRNAADYYRASLEALDTEVGRLLDGLPEEERARTVVLFMGDNGTPAKVAAEVYDLRGAKGSLYEGGTHVPMVVAGPGVQSGRSAALVSATDVYATVLELAGLEVPEIDGQSFLPALQGGQGPRETLYVEHIDEEEEGDTHAKGWTMRDARYKLVVTSRGERQLFDLQEDPFEAIDLLLGEPSDLYLDKAAALDAVEVALKAE